MKNTDVSDTPRHLRPGNCYVCGSEPHADRDHKFWSNADAARDFRSESRVDYSPEAAYVAEYRPY